MRELKQGKKHLYASLLKYPLVDENISQSLKVDDSSSRLNTTKHNDATRNNALFGNSL
ncbi:hypothetical protein [Aliagarivorans taiwanensis]|uniref:hypothetical protein n=1 Tax=Aliagarivorans taiwanensis TaxID=561966 RepID=UPI00041C6289|nr:hypothetical protein [Aliagarivorans taiwanensis]